MVLDSQGVIRFIRAIFEGEILLGTALISCTFGNFELPAVPPAQSCTRVSIGTAAGHFHIRIDKS